MIMRKYFAGQLLQCFALIFTDLKEGTARFIQMNIQLFQQRFIEIQSVITAKKRHRRFKIRYVRRQDLPRDWIERALPSIRAFSHFRRLALLENLLLNPGLSSQDLALRSRLCPPVFALHFGRLLRSGFVRVELDGALSLLPAPPPFATVLLAALKKDLRP